jgi:hypothetical protein
VCCIHVDGTLDILPDQRCEGPPLSNGRSPCENRQTDRHTDTQIGLTDRQAGSDRRLASSAHSLDLDSLRLERFQLLPHIPQPLHQQPPPPPTPTRARAQAAICQSALPAKLEPIPLPHGLAVVPTQLPSAHSITQQPVVRVLPRQCTTQALRLHPPPPPPSPPALGGPADAWSWRCSRTGRSTGPESRRWWCPPA